MENRLTRIYGSARLNKQQGLAMIIALFMLVAMTLAGASLVRSVNTGSQIAGNLSFRQDAASNADIVAQEAINELYVTLNSDSTGLDKSIATKGYQAKHPTGQLDPTGSAMLNTEGRLLIKWDSSYCKTFSNPADVEACNSSTLTPKRSTSPLTPGNTGHYIVFRMCNEEGSVDTANILCFTTTGLASNDCQGSIHYENEGKCTSSTSATPYYRVLARITGPRNTTIYTETIVHF